MFWLVALRALFSVKNSVDSKVADETQLRQSKTEFYYHGVKVVEQMDAHVLIPSLINMGATKTGMLIRKVAKNCFRLTGR